MNLFFSAAEISDHAEKSHGLMRFITSLSDEQARACIDHELRHDKRTNVLALLAAQVVHKKPFTGTETSPVVVYQPRQAGKTAHNKVLEALQMARAHVRCPLDGNALLDLRTTLDSAISLLGER